MKNTIKNKSIFTLLRKIEDHNEESALISVWRIQHESSNKFWLFASSNDSYYVLPVSTMKFNSVERSASWRFSDKNTGKVFNSLCSTNEAYGEWKATCMGIEKAYDLYKKIKAS